jgi:hypothetical protein
MKLPEIGNLMLLVLSSSREEGMVSFYLNIAHNSLRNGPSVFVSLMEGK